MQLLAPYRVLDLSDERGQLAGQILADLGADVVRIEPREGSPARRAGPFVPDGPEAERSLSFSVYNRNKRSAVLDLEDDSLVRQPAAQGPDLPERPGYGFSQSCGPCRGSARRENQAKAQSEPKNSVMSHG